MITTDTYIKIGTPLLFFNQPEIAPIKIRVAKSKKKGDTLVKCYVIGKNKNKIRSYTIEKLKTMSEDNYKLEASPEIESYEETRHISVEKGNHIAVFTLAFSAESIDNIIYPSRKSFEITKVEIGTKVIGIHIELDVSVVFLDLICNDTWITILEDEINDSFAGGCYEIIED